MLFLKIIYVLAMCIHQLVTLDKHANYCND